MTSKFSKLTLMLYLIIFIEGYVVLASEILAIRLVTSYVGNGVSTVSIIIAAVLMPLSFGYYAGGQFKPYRNAFGKFMTVRRKLLSNVTISAFFIAPALASFMVDVFFVSFFQQGISDRTILTSAYSLIFLIVPVFLLGQTIPLISNYFHARNLSATTARVLFVSTGGSFIGSVFTTLVMMYYFGVNDAANLIVVLMLVMVLMLNRSLINKNTMTIACLTLFMLFINSDKVLGKLGIIYANAYNTVSIVDRGDGKILSLNGSYSSFLGKDGSKFPYVEYIEKVYIDPIATDNGQPKKNILIIGAAGFTMGKEDHYNNYVYVDIDPDIKKVAEEKFLEEKLGPNKEFVGTDIISYLAGNPKKFDLIILDAYSSLIYIPEQLLTNDFFKRIHNSIAPKGLIVANLIMSPNFMDDFSRRVDNSFRSVFPNYGRQVLSENLNGWSDDPYAFTNVIYSYREGTANDTKIYTNNHNTSSFDKLGVRYKTSKQ